jgi:hypothetical protein
MRRRGRLTHAAERPPHACGGEAASRMRRRALLAQECASKTCAADACVWHVVLVGAPTRLVGVLVGVRALHPHPQDVRTPRICASLYACRHLVRTPRICASRVQRRDTPDLPCTRGLQYSCALYTCTRRICLVHEAFTTPAPCTLVHAGFALYTRPPGRTQRAPQNEATWMCAHSDTCRGSAVQTRRGSDSV